MAPQTYRVGCARKTGHLQLLERQAAGQGPGAGSPSQDPCQSTVPAGFHSHPGCEVGVPSGIPLPSVPLCPSSTASWGSTSHRYPAPAYAPGQPFEARRALPASQAQDAEPDCWAASASRPPESNSSLQQLPASLPKDPACPAATSPAVCTAGWGGHPSWQALQRSALGLPTHSPVPSGSIYMSRMDTQLLAGDTGPNLGVALPTRHGPGLSLPRQINLGSSPGLTPSSSGPHNTGHLTAAAQDKRSWPCRNSSSPGTAGGLASFLELPPCRATPTPAWPHTVGKASPGWSRPGAQRSSQQGLQGRGGLRPSAAPHVAQHLHSQATDGTVRVTREPAPAKWSCDWAPASGA